MGQHSSQAYEDFRQGDIRGGLWHTGLAVVSAFGIRAGLKGSALGKAGSTVDESSALAKVADETPSGAVQFRAVSGKVVEGGGGATIRQAQALAAEAAELSGKRLCDLVDEVRVASGNSFFRIENGKRVLGISESVMRSPQRSRRLLDGMHEIGHAESYAKRGYIPRKGSTEALKAEVAVERLAILRMNKNYGNIAQSVIEESLKYQREYFSLWRFAKRQGF
jgi:hypothetical protein